MNVAIEGCCHGELDLIYRRIKEKEAKDNIKIDILLCCGDFQAIRDELDLEDLCCPPKYKRYNDFKDYYNGIKEAPLLTIFVGGNHEAPALLKELYFGGWVAKNIYYMGHSGIVNVNGLRIAGISGIYNFNNYTCGYFETQPYDRSTKRSAYHVREFDVKKLELVKEPVDIFISHDWPQGIEQMGNVEDLLRTKPGLRHDVERKRLGNPYTRDLLRKLKPRYWFAAHMHVKFDATVKHDTGETYFLALDKPVGQRSFIEFMNIEPVGRQKRKQEMPVELCYDVEWLAIAKANHQKMPLNAFPSSVSIKLIEPEGYHGKAVLDALQNERCEQALSGERKLYKIKEPTDCCIKHPNRQREAFMKMLDLDNNAYFSPTSEPKLSVTFKV